MKTYTKAPMYSDKFGYFMMCPHCGYLNVIEKDDIIDKTHNCHGCRKWSAILDEDMWAVLETAKLYL